MIYQHSYLAELQTELNAFMNMFLNLTLHVRLDFKSHAFTADSWKHYSKITYGGIFASDNSILNGIM